jgi:Uma2 family endonuclease
MPSSTALKLPPALMTVDEFLDWSGDGTDTVYDLVDGALRAHAAPSGTHGRIHMRVGMMVQQHLDARHAGCSVLIGAGVRPQFRANWNFRIPDLAVTCARNEKGERAVPDPFILIELLSPSNRAETWDNVRNYITIPSVSEIVLIDTERVHADVFVRNAVGGFPDEPAVVEAGGLIKLASIAYDLPLDDAYRDTHLAVGG